MNYQNNEIGYIGFIHLIWRQKLKKWFRKFYENVRNFETEFFGYYRMSTKPFDELLDWGHTLESGTGSRHCVHTDLRNLVFCIDKSVYTGCRAPFAGGVFTGQDQGAYIKV